MRGSTITNFPRTPGRDYAGVVIDGPAAWIGREVFGSSGDLGIRRDGTHATHVVIEREAVVEKPRSLSWEEAAGIGVPFVTAMEALPLSARPTRVNFSSTRRLPRTPPTGDCSSVPAGGGLD